MGNSEVIHLLNEKRAICRSGVRSDRFGWNSYSIWTVRQFQNIKDKIAGCTTVAHRLPSSVLLHKTEACATA
jgi:hypothetical protein